MRRKVGREEGGKGRGGEGGARVAGSREGPVCSRRVVTAAPPRSILFICSGNICRSPLAHAYAAKVLAEMGRDDVTVTSAGTLGIVGEPAHPLAQEIGAEFGLDLTTHRSRPLTPFLLRAADLILGMTADHREAILGFHPEMAPKCRLLGSYRPGAAGTHREAIGDPLGLDDAHFRATFAEIREAIDYLVAQVFSGNPASRPARRATPDSR